MWANGSIESDRVTAPAGRGARPSAGLEFPLAEALAVACQKDPNLMWCPHDLGSDLKEPVHELIFRLPKHLDGPALEVIRCRRP